jgi:glycosyltransferase involved in cell wall biosynthesis
VPKWEEQVGTVNMQALACGTPVVSTKSGAIPEYIINGKIGLLAPEKNSQELAKNLLIIINNKKRAKQLSEAGREYALAHYDSKKNIERGEKIINELCHER